MPMLGAFTFSVMETKSVLSSRLPFQVRTSLWRRFEEILSIASPTPSFRNTLTALAQRVIPAPTSRNSQARSCTETSQPDCFRAIAVDRPPIPAPMMTARGINALQNLSYSHELSQQTRITLAEY